MTAADDRILEFVYEEGPKTPTKIANDGRVRFSRTYINTRCKKLAENGLLVHYGNGVYQITEKGQQYLSGDFDVEKMEEVDEGNSERRASA